jgi:hypothetical protein
MRGLAYRLSLSPLNLIFFFFAVFLVFYGSLNFQPETPRVFFGAVSVGLRHSWARP